MRMNFLMFAIILIVAIFSSCGAQPKRFVDSTTTVGDTMSNITDTSIDEKLTEALTKIETTTTESIKRIQQTASDYTQTTTLNPTTQTKIRTTASTQPVQKFYNVNNIESSRGDGRIKFMSVRTDTEYNRITFYYDILDYGTNKHLMPDYTRAKLIDKTGVEYSCIGFGEANRKGDIEFRVTDFDHADFSTVTLTYAFEGYDPVTVTFEIPGL